MWVCIFSTSCFNKPIKKYNTNFAPSTKKKFRFFFSFLCFLQRPLQLEFYTYISKQKRNTKGSSNPFNAKISFTSYHKAKKSPFYLGLSKNKNELTLLIPYHSNNKKTVYISKPLVNCNFHNAPLLP
jgi:hypothetical protein